MSNQPSPLESLASYAIAFAAGAISLAAISVYGQWMKRRGAHAALKENQFTGLIHDDNANT